MPSGKTISIAAPASFWYLKSFPIDKMAKELDYMVYMTYDLHGQWDYNNIWAQEGCAMGNCLRSHVNLTETNYVLAMITKAGVPSNMISVGVSSYGRAFGMTDSSCSSPMCTYGGPDSTAMPGKCTQTAGYISDAEILQLIGTPDGSTTQKSWYDTDSNSDLAIFNSTWVAYMSDNTKSSRTSYYQGLNFGGTVDWATDLQTFTGEDGELNDNSTDADQGPFTDPPPCTASYATIEDLDADSGNIPDNCKSLYIVSTLNNVLTAALQNYTDMMNNGYDDKFNTYSHAVADNAGSQVRDFQNNNGNKYFSCIVTELTFCCSQCSPEDNGCAYCFDGDCTEHCNQITGQCSSKRSLSNPSRSFWEIQMMDKRDGVGGGSPTPITRNSNQSEPCPPDMSKRGFGSNDMQSVYWTLNDGTADDFYSDLLNNTGIAKDKISFQNYDRGNDCAPSAGPDDPCWGSGYDYGMATPVGYDASDVTNPKDLVQKALDNSNNLAGQISDALTNLQLGCYYGDSSELVDSLSIPVLMIAQAVDSMSSIEATADEIDEEKRKSIILAFIGAILFFIPVVGEVVGSVTEAADIASIIAVIGAAGNAAMDVYTIVDDPKNAPLAIFSLILAPLGLSDLVTITRAANLRRGMKDSDIVALGGKVSDRMNTIKKITGTCPATK